MTAEILAIQMTEKMNKILTIVWISIAILFASCSSDVAYSRFIPIPSGEWHADSVLRFNYHIDDATVDYRMLVYVRHTERYPYQNMWLFFGDSIQRDTIEFYLADDRGMWLGNAHNGFIEMPVLLEENLNFPDTGTYYMEFQHAMRDTVLRGVTDIGLEIIINK